MNKKERESHVKAIEKEEQKRCPFDKTLKCEDCRLYVHFSKDSGKVCSIIFTAVRS